MKENFIYVYTHNQIPMNKMIIRIYSICKLLEILLLAKSNSYSQTMLISY